MNLFDDDAPDGGAASFATPPAIGRTPLFLLGIACGVAVLGVVLAYVATGPLLLLGWLLAGPIAFGVLAWFVNRDTRQRAFPVYGESALYGPLYWGSIVVAAVAVLASALPLAQWVAKL